MGCPCASGAIHQRPSVAANPPRAIPRYEPIPTLVKEIKPTCNPNESLFENTCIKRDCDACLQDQRTDFIGEETNTSLLEPEIADVWERDEDIRGEEGDYSAKELIDTAWSFIKLRSSRCSDYDGALRYLDFAMREMETDLYTDMLDIKEAVIDVNQSGKYPLPLDCQQIEYVSDQIFETNDWKVCGEPQDKYTRVKNAEFKRMRSPHFKFYTVVYRHIEINPLAMRPPKLLISYKANLPKYRGLDDRHRLTSDQYLMIIYKLILSFLDPAEPRWTYYSAKVQEMRVQDNGHQNSIDMADNFFAQNALPNLGSGGGF